MMYGKRIIEHIFELRGLRECQVSRVYNGWTVNDALLDILKRDEYILLNKIIVNTKCGKIGEFHRHQLNGVDEDGAEIHHEYWQFKKALHIKK